MSVDVSVVVPVYNTELFLRECIESLIHQTLRNVEFIFVDDGSTDSSVEIIEKYKKKDNRIKLIKQSNQYAGVARNNGMKAASGKYIIFLDSDDFFELNMLEEAFHCAEKNRAEITVFGFSKYDNQSEAVRKVLMKSLPQSVFSMDDMEEDFYVHYNAAPWNKLFLRSFIDENRLEFLPVRKSNDVYFTHMAACFAQRMVYLNKSLLYYRYRNFESLQGNQNCDRAAFVESHLEIRSKLIGEGLFCGIRKRAALFYTKDCIRHYGFSEDAKKESIQQYFHVIRESLIPGLFDSVKDFEDSPVIMAIYEERMEDILFYYANEYAKKVRELQDIQNTMLVSKNSKDYKIGHIILTIPRKIESIIKHIKR